VIRSPSTSTSARVVPEDDTTVPPLIRVRIAASLSASRDEECQGAVSGS
jgi:hypothetical protein